MASFVDRAPQLAACVIVLLIAAVVTFVLRIYIRLTSKNWGWDDWAIAAAAPPFLALVAACLGGSLHGIGVREKELTASQRREGMMFFFLFEIFWCLAVIPVKLSISFMLIRVAGPKQGYRRSIYFMSALFTVMDLIAFFYIVFQCTPVSYAWDTTTPGGSCQPAHILADIYYATTAVNIVTDWFTALLPIPLLWSVPLNFNAKVSVGFLFSLGVLASVCACIRLKYTVALTSADDYLHQVALVVLWGFAEVGIGFAVSCLSTLRPLFKRVIRVGHGSSGRRHNAIEEITDDPTFEMVSSLHPNHRQNQSRVLTSRTAERDDERNTSEESLVQDLMSKGIYIRKSLFQHTETHEEQ